MIDSLTISLVEITHILIIKFFFCGFRRNVSEYQSVYHSRGIYIAYYFFFILYHYLKIFQPYIERFNSAVIFRLSNFQWSMLTIFRLSCRNHVSKHKVPDVCDIPRWFSSNNPKIIFYFFCTLFHLIIRSCWSGWVWPVV